jgi:basic membrane protein A
MKKVLALILALVMALGLVACGNSGTKEPEKTESYKVAMITDYGDITDQSFNQSTYEGCKEYCEANSIDFKYYKPAGNSTAERVAMVDAAVADGYNVIVTPGYAFAGTILEVQDNYPDVKFIVLDCAKGDILEAGLPTIGKTYDYVPENWDESEFLRDNVAYVVYQEELCGYMAGYATVKLGYKHLGYCGGMAVPAVVRYGYGFLQGADAAATEMGLTDVVVEYAYANQFFGDADITAYMDNWYQTMGVECVFACGGGVFTSVAEAAAKVPGSKVVGVDNDQAGTIDAYGEGMTVTSAMKGLAVTVKNMLNDTIKNDKFGDFAKKITTLGLVSGDDPTANYVQIPYESTQWADGKFTQADYSALVKAMFDGTVKVSNAIDAEPTMTSAKVNYYGNMKG